MPDENRHLLMLALIAPARVAYRYDRFQSCLQAGVMLAHRQCVQFVPLSVEILRTYIHHDLAHLMSASIPGTLYERGK